MTLKTINDLNEDIDIPAYNQGLANPVITFKYELRKEAIAWIKELESKNEMTLEFAIMYGIKPFQLDYLNKAWKAEKKFTIGWIKHFFCISEEELK